MVEPDAAIIQTIMEAVAGRASDGMTVLGLCGAQGSGKSTLAAALMREFGSAAATLSLDDLYLTRAERQRLARDVHPLLATRGVPGTHDVALGVEVLEKLARGEGAALPRFSKADDDRLPKGDWDEAPRNCRLLIFEGWCVGARPQAEAALVEPVNRLEADEDPAAVWRHYANAALTGPYRQLFERIDKLVLLAAPDFDVVFDWRMQQEDELRTSTTLRGKGVMDRQAVARFIQHYERLTRHILTEMPDRADVLIRLDRNRQAVAINSR